MAIVVAIVAVIVVVIVAAVIVAVILRARLQVLRVVQHTVDITFAFRWNNQKTGKGYEAHGIHLGVIRVYRRAHN